jgi:hypothetical protein
MTKAAPARFARTVGPGQGFEVGYSILDEGHTLFRKADLGVHIMLRDELTLKCVNVKMVFGFGYPRVCRFRKTKQTNQILFLVRLIFFKT